MVIFYESSKTLNEQSITLFRSTNKPVEKVQTSKMMPFSTGSSLEHKRVMNCSLRVFDIWFVKDNHDGAYLIATKSIIKDKQNK